MTGQPPLRLFVAVFPPPVLQRALAALQPPPPLDETFRPVGAARIHLTVRFLGPTPAERLPELRDTLAATSWPESFTARSEALGIFPRIDRARVLWVGCGPRASFARLAMLLDDQLVPLGWPPRNEPFVPHLTLGRWRRPPRPTPLDRWLRSVEVPGEAFRVAEVRLVSSRPTPHGPDYRTLERYSLPSPSENDLTT